MNPIRIFFDTNVLVYAHDQSSVHHTDSAILLYKILLNFTELRIAVIAQNAKVDHLATYNIKDYKNIDNLSPMTPTQLLPQIC